MTDPTHRVRALRVAAAADVCRWSCSMASSFYGSATFGHLAPGRDEGVVVVGGDDRHIGSGRLAEGRENAKEVGGNAAECRGDACRVDGVVTGAREQIVRAQVEGDQRDELPMRVQEGD